jgi:multisubunit Na+/H+ antiporter MnhC subunit
VIDQFQHVMVLTSIIIGLGITYILIGLGSAVE